MRVMSPVLAISRPAAVAVVLASCIGYSGLFAMPMWVGPVGAAIGLSAFAVGLVASAQLGAAAIASFVAARVSRPTWIRRGTALGLLLIAVANLASAWAGSLSELLGARLVSGLGEGIVLALVNASIATTATPHRYFAWSQIGLGVSGLALFAAVPSLIQRFGASAVFLVVGCAALLPLALSARLPTRAEESCERSAEPSPSATSGMSWWALAGLAVTFIGCQGAWAFLVQAGAAKGIATADVARFLVIGQLLGLLGPVVAAAIGRRRSWEWSVALGLGVSALAVLFATQALPPEFFALSAFSFQFGTLCMVTGYLSCLATIDPSGRSAAAAPSALSLGCALGPAVIGSLWNSLGPALAGWAVVLSYGVALALLVFKRPALTQREAAAEG